jgi:hypothetical protein
LARGYSVALLIVAGVCVAAATTAFFLQEVPKAAPSHVLEEGEARAEAEA